MVVSPAHLRNYVDSLSYFRTVQIPLKNIIRDHKALDTFNLHVIMISRIINRKLFLDIARVICDKDNIPDNKRDPDNLKNVILQPPATLNSIQSFFKDHYSHTMQNDDYHTHDF